MDTVSFLPSYIAWHYGRAFRNIFGIFSNFFWAVWNFFSISLLLQTFFSPWRRLDQTSGKRFDPGEFFGNLVVNTLMRLVGMIVKSIVIVVGLFVLVALFVFEIGFFCLWILMPVVIVWLIVKGISKF